MNLRSNLDQIWRYLPWILLLLVVAAGVAKLQSPNPAPWLTPIGDASLIGLVILYVVYAVQHWASGNRWTSVLMLTLPMLVYTIAATAFSDPAQLASVLAVLFVFGAGGAGIICAAGAWGIRHLQGRGSRRHYHDTFPSGSVALIGHPPLWGCADRGDALIS